MRKYTKRKPMRLCDVAFGTKGSEGRRFEAQLHTEKPAANTNTRRTANDNDPIAIAAARLIAAGWATRAVGRQVHDEHELPDLPLTYTGYVARPKATKPKAERSVLVVRRNSEGRERTERIDVKGR